MWYKCDEESKILLVVWIESIMMNIQLILRRQVAWFILHLITNNLASVDEILAAWCIVLITRLLYEWTYDINMATWFLMLVSNITTTKYKSNLRKQNNEL